MADNEKHFCSEHHLWQSMLEKLSEDITEIKKALLGDFEQQGFIGITRDQLEKLETRVTELESWVNDKKKRFADALWKVGIAVALSILVGSLIIKFY